MKAGRVIANAVIAARRQRGEIVEGDTDLSRELTRQSLRFLYRILFLLYAEELQRRRACGAEELGCGPHGGRLSPV
jgi:hypothetical protein